MAARVYLPPAVVAQIENAADYVAKDNPDSVRALLERLYNRCLSLEHFPHRGAPYGDHYRRIIEGRYQIIYRIEESDADTTVVILAVHHTSRRSWEE